MQAKGTATSAHAFNRLWDIAPRRRRIIYEAPQAKDRRD